ncbi:MAG: thiamine-phosphate kinase [Pseudomonadota bacterium]|nr:thiamine-phosphate kinase [Pseudomonadota bacterium]
MSLGEFDLIAKYFTRRVSRAALGVGDDCALIRPAPGMQLAVSSDMLVEGRHFLPTVAADRLGHKALAVNLSDLAACGARPLGFTLALALPRVDETFLAGFARGMLALADAHDCELIGGDTTQGPLNLCITVLGEVPQGAALLRSGAQAGDDLYVSGTLGDARLALECFRGTVALRGEAFERVRRAMEQPQPRIELGIALRGIATSAIDVSDGLLGDLGHVLRRSHLGAEVEIDLLPRSADLGAMPQAWQRICTLAGGDDYELVFSAPPGRAREVALAAASAKVEVTRIGRLHATPGLRLLDRHGVEVGDTFAAFDHFSNP